MSNTTKFDKYIIVPINTEDDVVAASRFIDLNLSTTTTYSLSFVVPETPLDRKNMNQRIRLAELLTDYTKSPSSDNIQIGGIYGANNCHEQLYKLILYFVNKGEIVPFHTINQIIKLAVTLNIGKKYGCDQVLLTRCTHTGQPFECDLRIYDIMLNFMSKIGYVFTPGIMPSPTKENIHYQYGKFVQKVTNGLVPGLDSVEGSYFDSNIDRVTDSMLCPDFANLIYEIYNEYNLGDALSSV